MGNDITEKTCKSCKFYVEHYIKKATKFFPVGGHCVNDKVNSLQTRNMFELCDNCKFWESDEKRKEEERDKLKTVLYKMHKSLEQIAIILQNDN